MEIKLALKVNDKDNVATIFANGITDGTEVEILSLIHISSIICAFGLASAAPRSPYRHLELCGIAFVILL